MAREKREVRGKMVVKDLRSGVGMVALMDKYKLTSKGLRSVLKKLAAAGAISSAEFEEYSLLRNDELNAVRGLQSVRTIVPYPLIICDDEQPKVKGFVRDMSEKEITAEGLEIEIGVEKVLKVLSSELGHTDTFVFQAVCRRIQREEDKEPVVGFEITSISQEDLEKLRKLIQNNE